MHWYSYCAWHGLRLHDLRLHDLRLHDFPLPPKRVKQIYAEGEGELCS